MNDNLYYYRATAIRVVDGDTVDVDIDLGFDRITTRRRLRLLDVDTPERGQPGFMESAEFTSEILEGSREIIVSWSSVKTRLAPHPILGHDQATPVHENA